MRQKTIQGLEVSIEGKWAIVTELHEQEGYSVHMLCELSGLSRSSYYYQSQQKDERELNAAVEAVAGQFFESIIEH